MRNDNGSGLGLGLLIGGAVGLVAGLVLASGPAREQVDNLRERTIELTGRGDEFKARARDAADRARTALQDAENPVGRAVQEGVSAARRRRAELTGEDAPKQSTNPAPDSVL